MLAPFASELGLSRFASDYVPEVVALVFTLITTYLLVVDLGRPKLFLTLLTRPNTKSWLVKGAWILIAFSMCLPLELVLRWIARHSGPTELSIPDVLSKALCGINALLGLLEPYGVLELARGHPRAVVHQLAQERDVGGRPAESGDADPAPLARDRRQPDRPLLDAIAQLRVSARRLARRGITLLAETTSPGAGRSRA